LSCIKVGLGGQTPIVQLLRPFQLGARIVAVRAGRSDRRYLIVRWNVAVFADAELRFRLSQRAFGPIHRKLQFPRLNLDNNLSRFDFLADFNEYVFDNAIDFTAHPNLVLGKQSA
jgi:hypothetical protein